MNLISFAAVCFDFDGTLADNFDAIAATVNHVRASRSLPALAVREVKSFVGRGIDYLVEHAVPGGNLSQDIACVPRLFPQGNARGNNAVARRFASPGGPSRRRQTARRVQQ